MVTVTSYWAIDGIIVLMITITIITYFYMTRNFNYWKKQGVFEIKPLPFVGNFTNYILQRQPPVTVIKELYNRTKGKPYIGFYIFDKPCLLIRDREIIKDVLVKDFNYFCNRNSRSHVDDSLSNATLLFRKNPTWNIARSKVTLIFTSSRLKKMFNLLIECAVHLDTFLDSLGLDDEGKVLDMKDVLGNLTTEMICKTALGLDVNSINNPECVVRKTGKTIFNFNISRGIELFQVFFYPNFSRWLPSSFLGEKGATFLYDIFWDTMKHRMESDQKRGDLIDILIELNRNQDLHDFEFGKEDLVAQAAVFFTGGFESSSSTMSFALYELSLQPKLQERLRKEIFDALNETNGEITFDMIQSLPYLDMVVSETLRMYPILGVLDRETVESYQISNSDLIIEKGTPIFVSLHGLHYDPEYFPNPDKFDPERFNEENKNNIPSYAYMPFGEGPRKCIAIRLGLLQTKLGILTVLRRYRVVPCEKTVVPMIFEPKSPGTTPLNNEMYLKIQKLDTTY